MLFLPRNDLAMLRCYRVRSTYRALGTIRELVHSSDQRIAVLHGTYSGNTQKFAGFLRSELKWRLNLNASLKSIETLDFSDLNKLTEKDTLLLLVSTYGDGEPNEATKPLWEQLMTKEPLKCAFSVMSRGSSLYDTTFAKAGIKIDQMMEIQGGHRIAPLGIQDKMSLNGEDEYFSWKEGVIKALAAQLRIEEQPFRYIPVERQLAEVTHEERKSLQPEPILPPSSHLPQPLPIDVHLLQKTDRSYLYAEVGLPVSYAAGDYVGLWPTNADESVSKFLDAIFGDSPRRQNLLKYKGQVTSYELLAKHFLDIQGQPSKELILKLTDLAPSKQSEEALKSVLTSRQEIPDLASLLSTCSAGTPWMESLPLPSALFDLMPRQELRRYSISSAPVENPNIAGITAVVEHDATTGFWGTATGELFRMTQGESALKYGKENRIMAFHEPLKKFHLPKYSKIPLVLFGVGTGVAPYRGFIRERFIQWKQNGGSDVSSPIVLFTGTRTPGDFVHRTELEELAETDGFDLKIIPAYSRAENWDGPKYIADSLLQNEELIFNLLSSGGHLYVCGDIRKVRRTVRKGIIKMFIERLGLSAKEAKAKWKAMTKGKQIHLELW